MVMFMLRSLYPLWKRLPVPVGQERWVGVRVDLEAVMVEIKVFSLAENRIQAAQLTASQ
jgi:hypothetical protein